MQLVQKLPDLNSNIKIFVVVNILLFFFLLRTSVAQPILLNDKNFPNEPAIAVNPKNPKQILVGAAVGQAFLSNDSGKTFVKIPLDEEYGLWSDPSVFFDKKGNAYYFHLSGTKKGKSSDRIICQKKKRNEELFHLRNTIGYHPTACLERPIAVYNPYKDHIYLTYVIFDAYGSINPKDSTRLYFTYSDDKGETWETPIRLSAFAGDCSDRDSSVQGATTVFDKDGNLAVVWGANYKIWINTFNAKEKQWQKTETIVANQPEGWDFNIPNLKMPNGLPVVVNYTQNKENQLFVFWAQFNKEKNNSLVYYTYSNDWGKTWIEPQALSEVNQNVFQFHVWASVHKNNMVVSCYEQLPNGLTYMRLFNYDNTTKKFTSTKLEETVFSSDPEQYLGDMNQVYIFNQKLYLPFIKSQKGENNLYLLTRDLNSGNKSR